MTLSVTSAPWQQVPMPAVDLRRYLDALVASEGVASGTDLVVAQRGAGANMSVDIAAGSALVQGDVVVGQGIYLAYNDAAFNLTGFTAAHATLPRIDRVVIRVRDAFHGDAANDVSFQILTGTATSGATLANLTGAAAVGNSQLLLANILVPATATTITTANIGNVAGLLTPAGGGLTTYTKVTQKDVTNTAAATDLLNGEITIGANVLTAGKTLHFTLIGDLLHNQNVGTTYAFAAFFGATQIAGTYTTTSINAVQSATRYWWRIEGTCHGLTSATQESFARFSAMAAAGTGAAEALAGAFSGTAAVDMTTSQVFAVKATCSTASTLESLRLRSAHVQVR